MFKCDFFIQERSFVAVVGKWAGVKDLVGFVNEYGPLDSRERKERKEVKWCIFGDFNDVKGEHERLNSHTNAREVEDFNEFIRKSRLVEVPMGNQKYTRVTDDGRIYSKLAVH